MATNINRVVLNGDDIVEISVVGDQTPRSVIDMSEQAGRLCRQQWTDGKQALILDDLTRIGSWTPGALRRVIAIAKTFNYDKLAMVSDKRAIQASSNMVLMAIGKYGKVRFFESHDTATTWLKQDSL